MTLVTRKVLIALVSVVVLLKLATAYGETTKLIVAYASPAATFCPGWIAKREGIFAKYHLDVEMVLMQGASTYMPALASGNIQVLYGGGTAVSRAIATGGFDLAVIATETRYVPLRMMVNASIQTTADLKGKKLGAGRAGLDEYATILYLEKLGFTPGKERANRLPRRRCAKPGGDDEARLDRRRGCKSSQRIRSREGRVSRARQFFRFQDALCRRATDCEQIVSRPKPKDSG